MFYIIEHLGHYQSLGECGMRLVLFPLLLIRLRCLYYTLPNFFKQWNEDPIDFVFFPLEDNGSPFNLCKSNISWLESTQIGAAFYTNMISSDEFNYKGVGTFIDGLMIDIEGALIQKKNLWEHSVSEIENNFNINEINKFRKHLIQELLL